MNIKAYIRALDKKFAGGAATEHTYRSALEALLEEVATKPNLLVTNEPKQIPCGMPDFTVAREGAPVGWVEAKDLDKDLDAPAHEEQIERYADALNNLIVTNYLEFRLLVDGKPAAVARIGEVRDGRVVLLEKNVFAFKELLAAFAAYKGITVLTAGELANHMAAKARMLAAVIKDSIAQDESTGGKNSELQEQLQAFREYLIHNTPPAEFAAIYAQTIAYGMFAARLQDDDILNKFGRLEAAQLIPAANPFLRKFFQHIAGFDLDKRIKWTVDTLADLFQAADVGELMKGYGKATRRNDPFLHFYETFLGAYDAKLRKKRGVYYTPEPAVDFIVRAVDDILRDEFQLRGGLGAADKTVVAVETENGKRRKKEVHKVQILDPAAGTGTFLAAIVRHIRGKFAAGQKGRWPGYVKKHLIPRLNGFEIQMAPYVMAHTKLDMVLRETNVALGGERLRIYLTNALESHHPSASTVFAEWFSEESNKASEIKRDTPVMVVVGNPPYRSESANTGEWITGLLKAYRKEPGGKEKLKERTSKTLNDDYVKFIRCGQHFVDNTGEGILAYVNNHGFLDNPTFRGMRWHLLQSFDKIYILDLHGNARKKETAPDGSPDKNIFDIMQGVSINIFVKTGKKKASAPAQVFHFDLFGGREEKYAFLGRDFAKVKFAKLSPRAPQFFFVPKKYSLQKEYEKGFSVKELFPASGMGVTSAHDEFVIDMDKDKLIARFQKFKDSPRESEFLHREFHVRKKKGWDILAGYDNIKNVADIGALVRPISYRPFDSRHIFYDSKLVWRTVEKILHNFFTGPNFGLIAKRGFDEENSAPVFVTKEMIDRRFWSRPGMQGTESVFPLYIHPNSTQKDLDKTPVREPNLNQTIVDQIAELTGLRFTAEKTRAAKAFAPVDLLDYVYAALHSPRYRKRYNEFLKIDFPRAPYPANAAHFQQLAKLGNKLRKLHLLEAGNTRRVSFPETGDDKITARIGRDSHQLTDRKNRGGRVYINHRQYFGNVPETAWNFPIGGYQPAQKWLKDRQNRRLSDGEITHYQNMISALAETARVVAEIDRG